MTESAVEAQLTEVIDSWRVKGPLEAMLDIIDAVWRINLDRHEPGGLGDDAMSLGIQCSRNIMNRCNKELPKDGDFVVSGGQTLEVRFAGHVMHLSKVSTQSLHWDPYSIDWNGSDVRLDGAQANAEAFTPTRGTLFDGREELLHPSGDPAFLTHLHLAWQGLSDGHVRSFVGFPTTGSIPWSAVKLVRHGRSTGSGMPIRDTGTPSAPNHDSMAEPALPMRRRTQPLEADNARGSA